MPEKQEVVCSGCRKRLRIPEKYWGKKVRCPQCREVLSIPAEPVLDAEEILDDVELIAEDDPFVDENPYADDDPFADMPPAQVSAPPRRRRSAPRSKKKKKKSRNVDNESGGAFSAEKNMLNAGVMGGCGLIALAVIWFVGGLFFGILFYYPPILVVIGLVSIVKGLLGSD